MSSWQITIRHTTDDGEKSVVSKQGNYKNDGSTIAELACMANELANVFVAFQHLGQTVPCDGKEVLDCFCGIFGEDWGYWQNKEE